MLYKLFSVSDISINIRERPSLSQCSSLVSEHQGPPACFSLDMSGKKNDVFICFADGKAQRVYLPCLAEELALGEPEKWAAQQGCCQTAPGPSEVLSALAMGICVAATSAVGFSLSKDMYVLIMYINHRF